MRIIAGKYKNIELYEPACSSSLARAILKVHNESDDYKNETSLLSNFIKKNFNANAVGKSLSQAVRRLGTDLK